MTLIALLRRGDANAHAATHHLHHALCEHRFAQAAKNYALADGFIKNPMPRDAAYAFMYGAAKPVAAATLGPRVWGFRAAGCWGASVSTSLMRHELPLLGLYIASLFENPIRPMMQAAGHLGAARRRAMPSGATDPRTRQTREAEDQQERRHGHYRAAALAGTAGAVLAEYVAGTPHRCDPGVHPPRGTGAPSILRLAREHGLLGALRLGLLAASEQPRVRRGGLAEAGLVSAAMMVNGLSLCVQLMGAAWMAVVAGTGCAAGLVIEAGYRIVYWRAAGVPVRLSEAAYNEAQRLQREMQQNADDEHLAAPFIDGLWAQAAPGLHGEGYRRRRGQAVGHMADAVMWLMGGVQGLRGVNAQPGVHVPFEGAPQAARAPRMAEEAPRADTANVHGAGRDAATRRSLATLLHRYPKLDTAREVAALRTYLAALAHQHHALARRPHASGVSVLQAATQALDGDRHRRLGFFTPVTDPHNTLHIPEGGLGTVPMARVCAVIWHAIGTLVAPSRNVQDTEALRADRREALVSALGQCISDGGEVVCAPGQSQRLVLVLQGCTPGVQVEMYDAPAPVAQFVTAQAMSMHHKLGEEGPWDLQVVRRYFDEAFLAGAMLYSGAQRDDLAQQLAVLADMTYDLDDWTPPQG